MNPVKGHYSIVQYCPDIARRETVNLGVVLFVQELGVLDSRMTEDNDRVRQFFGTKGADFKLLADFKRSFTDRIESEKGRIHSVEALQKFIDTRGNQIQLTQPMFVKVRDSKETLNFLYDQLVGGRSKPKKRESLKEMILSQFEAGEIANLVETDVPISLPFLNRERKFPFGYQNSAFHLMQPVSFQEITEEASFNRALKFSMEGKILQQQKDKEYGTLKFDVIGSFSDESDPAISIVRNVLGESDVELYVAHDLSPLIESIRTHGKKRAS